MYIEISGDTENLVRAHPWHLGSSNRPRKPFPAMARTWAIQHPARVSLVPQLDQDTDIRVLVTEQGVLPFDPKKQANTGFLA